MNGPLPYYIIFSKEKKKIIILCRSFLRIQLGRQMMADDKRTRNSHILKEINYISFFIICFTRHE